jgi:hypothetical protein
LSTKFWLSFVSNTGEFELRLKALNFWRQMKDFFGARYRISFRRRIGNRRSKWKCKVRPQKRRSQKKEAVETEDVEVHKFE